MGFGSTATYVEVDPDSTASSITLPGASSIPAPDANHVRMSAECGRRIVQMVWDDLTPARLLSAGSFANAIAVAMAGTNMKDAKDHGADFMVTPCPLCHMSLDIYQERAGRAVKTDLNLPILHLPQLLRLAMGIPAQDLGLSRHLISVDRIVTRLQQPNTPHSSLPAEPRT